MNFARKKMGHVARKEAIAAYMFISPLVIGLLVFNFFSFIVNIFYSFTNKTTFGTPKWVGLANFTRILQGDKFYSALFNTFRYVVICVPAVVIIAIITAALLNTGIKGKGIYRTLLFLPAVTMPAAAGLVWKWIFNYEFGIINSITGMFGADKAAFLSDPSIALYAVCIVLIWTDISTRMIILLAGLQNIPEVYYEAARIDGAKPLQTFFRITLPLLSPSIFFVTVMQVIGVFQIFDFIFLMIPQNSSGNAAARSLVSYFYEATYVENRHGAGAAVTIILFVIILIVTVFQMRMQKKWVHYE